MTDEDDIPWALESRRIGVIIDTVWTYMGARDWDGLNSYLEQADLTNLLEVEIVAHHSPPEANYPIGLL